MPMTRVSMKRGKSAHYKRAILDNIYEAMRETFNCPEDDKFLLLSEHDDGEFCYSPTYLGVARSDDLVFIQITCNNTRTVEMKKALYKRVAERLGDAVSLRPEDVFISLVEVAKENWSLGNGEAQYAG
jgi:4-oxalocrotonate tautomerase